MRHAAAAEAIEVAFNPAAGIEYQLFRAGITDDATELSRLLPELRGRWDSAKRATALRGIARVHHGERDGIEAAAEAWLLSPGEMVTNGLRVPVAIEEGVAAEITRTLARMGFRVVPESPLLLEVSAEEGELRYVMRERRSSRTVRQGRVRYGGARHDLRRAVEEVALLLTRVEDAVIQELHPAELPAAERPTQEPRNESLPVE